MKHRITRRTFFRWLGAGVVAVSSFDALQLLTARKVYATVEVETRAHEEEQNVDNERVFQLPFNASHVALHWDHAHDALIHVAFETGSGFGAMVAVRHDEVGEQKNDGRTYGAVMLASGATAVRVVTDRPVSRLRVLAMVDGKLTVKQHFVDGGGAFAAVNMPPVTSRAGWGCDESLMTWPPAFYAIQKLITHHTATQNNDPDPAATIRSIYYYHAVTQGWGDIGYNFLIDESGRIYEGRYSRQYPAGVYPNGEDANGNGVTGAHAYQFNSGTAGIALLGTLTNQDTTPAGRHAMEQILAWKAAMHNINPKGSTVYTNPVTGASTRFANIAGHRDVNATECPGGVFYNTLPMVRSDVAAMIAGQPTPTPTPTPTSTPTPTPKPTPSPTPTPKPTPTPSPTPGDQGGQH